MANGNLDLAAQQVKPDGGKRNRLADALKQGHARAPPDGGHLTAQCGLGQAELAGSSRQQTSFGGLQKCLELVSVEFVHAKMHMFTAIYRSSLLCFG